jgi:hypothetical protein
VIELKIDQDSPIFFNIAGGRRLLALFHTTIARKKETWPLGLGSVRFILRGI